MKEYSFKHFESIGVVFADEAHHVCARVFSQAFFKFCPRYAFALSATPERNDGLTKILSWFFGTETFVAQRENQTQVTVRKVDFDCPQFQQCPPMTRFGKISLSLILSELVAIEERKNLLRKLIDDTRKEVRRLRLAPSGSV